MNPVKIVIIAHNECKIVKLQIEFLVKIVGLAKTDFIIVDNFSDDGLAQWLSEQQDIDYIVCDERVESYVDIINTVVGEFIRDEDVLVLSPGIFLLQGSINELSRILSLYDNAGIIYPYLLRYGETIDLCDVQTAIKEAKKDTQGREITQHIGTREDAFLVRNEVLKKMNGLDKTIKQPKNILADLCLTLCEMGYACYEANNAFGYRFLSVEDVYDQMYGEDIDRKRMKEKWGMNYFNETPNLCILSKIDEDKDKTLYVLEIGCDCGANLLWIKNRYPNAKLFGVEINPAAAKVANHFVNTKIGDIEEQNLNFGDVRFDYIIFGDVLEHLKNPAAAINYCKNILASEGKILASIPNLMHYTVLQKLLNGYFTYSDTGLLDRTHIHFFTYYEVLRMFESEGYKIVELQYNHVEQCTEEEDKFIDNLLKMSNNTEKFMFLAFQYIVTAQPVRDV